VPQVALFLQEEAASHVSGRRWRPQHPETGVPYPSVVPPRRSEANLALVASHSMQNCATLPTLRFLELRGVPLLRSSGFPYRSLRQ
jgi:hypothetical protein